MRGRWRALTMWWSAAGSAAQLGAVVGVVAIVIGTTCAGVQMLKDDPPPVPAPVVQPTGVRDPRLEFAVTLPALETDCTASWIVPRTLAEGSRYDPLEVPADGTLGTDSAIELVVQETTGRTIVVHSIRAEVVGRGPAVAGTKLVTACGGPLSQARLKTDLDDATGRVVARDPKDTNLFPWTIAENDPAAYSVQVHTAQGRVEFVLVLEWSWGGRQERTVVNNGGKPFAVSSAGRAVLMCGSKGIWSNPGCR